MQAARRPGIGTEAQFVAEAMRAIRKMRRMSTGEVARAMGMPVRSYEHLEEGSGRITYDRIASFAEATDSDPIAILTSPAFKSSDFAIRCANNKLMAIMMISMMELNDDLGRDVELLQVNNLVGGFTRLAKDLAKQVRARETFAEEWLKEGVTKLAPAPVSLRPARS